MDLDLALALLALVVAVGTLAYVLLADHDASEPPDIEPSDGTHKAQPFMDPTETHGGQTWLADNAEPDDVAEPRAADYPGYHTTEPEPPLHDEDFPERDET